MKYSVNRLSILSLVIILGLSAIAGCAGSRRCKDLRVRMEEVEKENTRLREEIELLERANAELRVRLGEQMRPEIEKEIIQLRSMLEKEAQKLGPTEEDLRERIEKKQAELKAKMEQEAAELRKRMKKRKEKKEK